MPVGVSSALNPSDAGGHPETPTQPSVLSSFSQNIQIMPSDEKPIPPDSSQTTPWYNKTVAQPYRYPTWIGNKEKKDGPGLAPNLAQVRRGSTTSSARPCHGNVWRGERLSVNILDKNATALNVGLRNSANTVNTQT